MVVVPGSVTQFVSEAKVGGVSIAERGTMPNPIPERLPAHVRLVGNIGAAKDYLPVARRQLAMMHANNADDYEIWGSKYKDNKGTRINCYRNFDNDSVEVVVPTSFVVQKQTLTKTVNSGGTTVDISGWEDEE